MKSSQFDFNQNEDPENLLPGFFGKKDAFAGFRDPFQRLEREFKFPKTIHQIWLGSLLPSKLEKLRQTWIKHHPDWQFRLWTDQDLNQFECKDLVDSTSCFGQKSDLLRAEIIYRHGGLYVDLDYECYQSIEPWIRGHSFVTGFRWILQAHLGWPQVWKDPLVVCNSLFGAEARHPLLANYLKLVRAHWNERDQLDLKAHELDRISLAVMGGEKRASHMKETGLRTYLPFHELVSKARAEATVFPPSFFNPRLAMWPSIYAMPQFWYARKISGRPIPKLWKYSKVQPHTVACHLSHTSWL